MIKQRFYDFIVIGTGASGSVLAHYLSSAGASVCFLEAGKRYRPEQYPDNELQASTQLTWNGGMDPSLDARIVHIRGKVVGGGTVLNNCLLDRFDDTALDDFRSTSGIGFYNRTTMDAHYREIESQLQLKHISETDWNGNAQLYARGFDQLGLKRAPLRRGQSQCDNKNSDCIVCLGGCPRSSKQSMTVSFLPSALAKGAVLKQQFHVHQIIHGYKQVAVYGTERGAGQVIYGRKCVLAAGSLGTTELLLKSGFANSLPALGKGFFCHPQFMSLAVMDQIVDAHKGAFQALKSDDSRFRQQGFKLENVFAGPAAVAQLIPGFGANHQELMSRYRHMACIEVAVRDQNPGILQLSNKKRLVIDKTLNDGDQQRAEAGRQQIRDIFSAVGARKVIESPICIALHLMGGCSIGNDEQRSVVNEQFLVHGFDNLAIADSSIFPSAPGINPSLTIMAQSQRASQALLAEFGEKPDSKRSLNFTSSSDNKELQE